MGGEVPQASKEKQDDLPKRAKIHQQRRTTKELEAAPDEVKRYISTLPKKRRSCKTDARGVPANPRYLDGLDIPVIDTEYVQGMPAGV